MRKPVEEDKNSEQLRIVEEQAQYYNEVMKRFDRKCVVCFPYDTIFGVTVHEIIPRSKNPKGWWKDIENGCPLCQYHHDKVHAMPSKEAEEFCRNRMESVLLSLGRL